MRKAKTKPRIIVETTDTFKKQTEEQAKKSGFQSTSAYIVYLINKDLEPKQ